jgi:hypothetical protein
MQNYEVYHSKIAICSFGFNTQEGSTMNEPLQHRSETLACSLQLLSIYSSRVL